MKKISKSLYNACLFYKFHPQQSISSIANDFKVDRHSITKHLLDYKKYSYLKDEYCYFLTEEELAPVLYYLEHLNESLSSIAKKYKTKGDTIKRRLSVIGLQYLRRTKRKYNRSIFNLLDTELKAYWLGFILADGYINLDRGFLKIKLAKKDEEHLQKFCDFIEEKQNIIKHETGGAYTKNNICSSILFDSRELVNNLVKYGLHQNKSGKEKPIEMPNLIMEKAYLRGMIDGDGHIENGYFKYVGSLDSCLYMKNKFSKWYTFKNENKYIYEHGKIYSFEIRSKEVNNILKNIYNSNIYLNRKYEVVQSF